MTDVNNVKTDVGWAIVELFGRIRREPVHLYELPELSGGHGPRGYRNEERPRYGSDEGDEEEAERAGSEVE